MTCADNRHAAGTCDVPVTLEVKQLYRMFGVTQLGRILACTMHANAEVLNASGTDCAQCHTRILAGVCLRDKIRGERSGVLAEHVGERLERRAFFYPQRLVRSQFTRRHYGARLKIDCIAMGEQIVHRPSRTILITVQTYSIRDLVTILGCEIAGL